MGTIGIADLKQNPREVVERVRETGEDLEILIYNQPTGVTLTSKTTRPRQVVLGSDLIELAKRSPMSRENASRWIDDIRQLRELEDDSPTDPWETS